MARETLAKARRYGDRAREVENSDRAAFNDHLEAAVVYGRSVMHHLHKQFARKSGFKTWFSGQERRLRSSPTGVQLLELRNVILKEGPVGVRRVVSIHAEGSVAVTGYAEFSAVRAQPWFSRDLRLVCWDVRAWVTKPVRRALRQLRVQHRRPSTGPSGSVEAAMYFDVDGLRDKPALDYIDEYFCLLEEVVTSAEQQFGAA